MGNPLAARPQRLRHHLRRPTRKRCQLTVPDAVTPFFRQTPQPRTGERGSVGLLRLLIFGRIGPFIALIQWKGGLWCVFGFFARLRS